MWTALFLDRDGVINADKHHAYRIEGMVFVVGVFDLPRNARSAGLLLIVISNEAGIAHGKFPEADLFVLMTWRAEGFAAEGSPLTAVYHSPTHADFSEATRDSAFAGCGKPDPETLLDAARDHASDLRNSNRIGDGWGDAQAGVAAGLRRVSVIEASEPGPAPAIPRMERGNDLPGALEWHCDQRVL